MGELVTKKISPEGGMLVGHCVLHLYNVSTSDSGKYTVVFPGKLIDNGEFILNATEMTTGEMTTDSLLWPGIVVCLLIMVIIIVIILLLIWKVKKRLNDKVERSQDSLT